MQRVPAGPVDREETPDWALGIASFLPDRRQSARGQAPERARARARAYRRTALGDVGAAADDFET